MLFLFDPSNFLQQNRDELIYDDERRSVKDVPSLIPGSIRHGAKLVVSVEVNVGVVDAAGTGGLSPNKHGRSGHTPRAIRGGASVGGIGDPFMLPARSTLRVCNSHCTDMGALKGSGSVGRCHTRRREQTQQQGQTREQADQSYSHTKRQSHRCFSLSAREIMVLMHMLSASVMW